VTEEGKLNIHKNSEDQRFDTDVVKLMQERWPEGHKSQQSILSGHSKNKMHPFHHGNSQIKEVSSKL